MAQPPLQGLETSSQPINSAWAAARPPSPLNGARGGGPPIIPRWCPGAAARPSSPDGARGRRPARSPSALRAFG
ncbi:hypothetical protein HMPREF1136_2034, partial [Actinomyces sp. ICM47]